MLGEAGSGYGLCRVVRAVLFCKTVHDVLLSRDAAAGGIQFKVDAVVFFKVLLQGKIGIAGLCLNLRLISHGVHDRDSLQRIFPALRQGVVLIHQHQIIDPFGGFLFLSPGTDSADAGKQHRNEEKGRDTLHFAFLRFWKRVSRQIRTWFIETKSCKSENQDLVHRNKICAVQCFGAR